MVRRRKKLTPPPTVTLRITRDGQLRCRPVRVEVQPGDRLIWQWSGREDFPFGLVIKSPFTPLLRHYYVTSLRPGVGKIIETRVLNCAPPGTYPYLVAAFCDRRLLVEDPEIIIRPPADGRK